MSSSANPPSQLAPPVARPAGAGGAGAAPSPAAAPASTAELLLALLKGSAPISDLYFTPGKPPLAEINGKLVAAGTSRALTPDDTKRIAFDLMGSNQHALENLKERGSCDVSYSLPSAHRFRVNVFVQRGAHAVVMRVIPAKVPDLDSLHLPTELNQIVHLRNGIVLVTGPTGSGKSSTLAAIIDKINREQSYHVLTIEDPIEFLHSHKSCIVHQRELHSDTPSFALALRAALRQAPKVILVGEMRDKETIEIAMEAAETGHLVLSTLHTIDASKTVERIVGAFPMGEQHTLRNRLAKSFRYIISQRLVPRQDGAGRVAVIEILKSTLRTRDYVEKGESEGKTLLEAMNDGIQDGMQTFDGDIQRLIREGTLDMKTGLAYATNPNNLELELSDLKLEAKTEPQVEADPLLETAEGSG